MTTTWIIALALGSAACTDPAPSSCPADEPTSCPSPAPSYANEVAPLIEHYCVQCHSAGGMASDQPLSSYAALAQRALDANTQLYQCRMPQAPVDPPTLDERVTLLAWFVCGAPNN